MSTTGITTSLLSQIVGSPSELNQFVTDLNQLAEDLQGGNQSAAQQDYATLSEDALNGATSSTATSTAGGITASLLSNVASSQSSSTSFVNELNQLGADLQNGDLTSAQEDLLNLDSTALNAVSSGASSASISPLINTPTKPPSQAEITELVDTIVTAMEDGDDAIVSSAMSELATISPSSQGASVLAQESENFGSGGSSSSGSISQLLQNSNSEGNGESSILNEIA
jgi:hypothetical protein